MAKKRNVAFVGLALITVVGFISYFRSEENGTAATAVDRAPQVPKTSTPASSFPMTAPSGTIAPTISAPEQQRRFQAAFVTPISFFGRVVDQYGAAIPLADIRMAANDKPLGGRPSEYVAKSGSNGLFSITDIRGLTLSVEVSKPGYQVIPPADGKVTSSGVFEYGLSSSRGQHNPQKDAPILFTLRKLGPVEPLQRVGQRNFRIQRDGTPLTLSLDQAGQHNIILRCWNNDLQRTEGQRQYDWRFEVTVLHGGLVPRAGLDTEAPVDGYVPKDLIEMPASLRAQAWHGFVERSYFIRFDDQTFGRAKLEMHAGGDHFVAWESFFNPKPSSRNLEKAESTASE